MVSFLTFDFMAHFVCRARGELARGKLQMPSEWKILLEQILLEYRDGQIETALKLVSGSSTTPIVSSLSLLILS
jgi:hypothetical protein